MATNVLPIAKAVYLSDDVVQDRQSRKLHVVGIFNAIRPPGQQTYPYQPRQICVFAQLTGGLGEVSVHVEIVEAATEEAIYVFQEQRIRFATRRSTVSACFRIRDCEFPAAGVYIVELYCNGLFLDDRALELLEAGAES